MEPTATPGWVFWPMLVFLFDIVRLLKPLFVTSRLTTTKEMMGLGKTLTRYAGLDLQPPRPSGHQNRDRLSIVNCNSDRGSQDGLFWGWETQIRTHIDLSRIVALVTYYGPSRHQAISQFAESDIVLYDLRCNYFEWTLFPRIAGIGWFSMRESCPHAGIAASLKFDGVYLVVSLLANIYC